MIKARPSRRGGPAPVLREPKSGLVVSIAA
jgi:hypothetical protein